MFPTEIFSERLVLVRKDRNTSAKALAEAIGISKAAISQFESGKNAPSASILIALADYFDVSLDYLVGRSDTPHILSPDELEVIQHYKEIEELEADAD